MSSAWSLFRLVGCLRSPAITLNSRNLCCCSWPGSTTAGRWPGTTDRSARQWWLVVRARCAWRATKRWHRRYGDWEARAHLAPPADGSTRPSWMRSGVHRRRGTTDPSVTAGRPWSEDIDMLSGPSGSALPAIDSISGRNRSNRGINPLLQFSNLRRIVAVRRISK